MEDEPTLTFHPGDRTLGGLRGSLDWRGWRTRALRRNSGEHGLGRSGFPAISRTNRFDEFTFRLASVVCGWRNRLRFRADWCPFRCSFWTLPVHARVATNVLARSGRAFVCLDGIDRLRSRNARSGFNWRRVDDGHRFGDRSGSFSTACVLAVDRGRPLLWNSSA